MTKYINWTEQFQRAVAILLQIEGGYVNDPNDPGGETKYGISKRTYPNIDIKNLTILQAKTIYYNDWWLKYHYNGIHNQAIAIQVLLMATNMGAAPAQKILQQAVNKCEGQDVLVIDGLIGPKTLESINSTNSYSLLSWYRAFSAARYCSDAEFDIDGAGWLNRTYQR